MKIISKILVPLKEDEGHELRKNAVIKEITIIASGILRRRIKFKTSENSPKRTGPNERWRQRRTLGNCHG